MRSAYIHESRHTAHTLQIFQVFPLPSFPLGILYKYVFTFQAPSLSLYPPSSVYQRLGLNSSINTTGSVRLCQNVCMFIKSQLESPDCCDFRPVPRFAGTSHSILASAHMKKEDLCVCVCLINWNIGHIAHTLHSQL